MGNIKIIQGAFDTKLELEHEARPKVKADVFANAIKHDYKSKNPTTRWSDVKSFEIIMMS